MKGTKFYMLLLLLMLSTFSISAQTVDDSKLPEEVMPEGLYIPPYVQNVTQDSVTIMWETTSETIGVVEYGLPAKVVKESSARKLHEVKITGLKPGTKYRYQVKYGDVELEPSYFKTAPRTGVKSVRLVVYGDSRSYPGRHRRLAGRILKEEPDLIINTGDLISNGTQYEQWQQQFFLPLRHLIDHIPIYACLGNHEANSKHYFNYLSLPGNEVYYSFDYANVHFICLDSTSAYTPYDESSPQYKWLIDDLSKQKGDKWIVVFFHAPLFRAHPTRGIEPQRYIWQQVFDKFGVDIVFNGHDHHYVRTFPIGSLGTQAQKGVTHITTGGGGAPLYDIVTGRSYIAVAKKIHHFVVMDFSGDVANARVIDIDGNQVDAFSIARNEPAKPDEYVSYEVFEFERNLREQMLKQLPILVESEKQEVSINTAISVKTNFGLRVEGEIFWAVPSEGSANLVRADDKNTRWKFDQVSREFAINPGAELKIPLNARASYPDVYPLPRLIISFDKLIGAQEAGFRNNKVELYPFKILPRISTEVPKIASKLEFEGVLNRELWNNLPPIGSFLVTQGDDRPDRESIVRLFRDDEYLYMIAELHSNKLESFETNRDASNIVQSEHVKLVFAKDQTTYTFAINPQGSILDAKGSDVQWNLDWKAKATVNDGYWIAVLAIPVSFLRDELLDGSSSSIYFNVIRFDSEHKEESLLVPTFYPTERENKLPEYSSSIRQLELCPKMIIKWTD